MNSTEDRVNAVASERTLVNFIPPSLLRVRRFLFENGMRIVPWAPAHEVLDDFRELLDQRRDDTSFWSHAAELLDALQGDLRLRLSGPVQDNDILTSADRERLLGAIRQHLEQERSSNSGFRALAEALPQRPLAILLLLGSAVVVGCGAMTEFAPTDRAAGGAQGTGGAHATGGSQAIATGGHNSCPKGTPDGGIQVQSIAQVEGIARQCLTDPSTLDAVLSCLTTLNASWQQGVEQLLSCTDCQTAVYYLNQLLNSCSNLPPQYASCMFLDCGIYIGVRMD